MIERKRVGVISLGCDKNRVDTEKMLSLVKTRHDIVKHIEDAQIIIINTCAFLKSSREEALSEIFSASAYKQSGQCEKIVVTGCLPQKFIDGIYSDLTEADAFLGVSDYGEILTVIDRLYKGERVNAVGCPREECGTDRVLTTDNYAYLKIADGCSNHCTYCLIPKIRGKYRSVPEEMLIEEARKLGEVPELILVAQDTACYGKDLTSKSSLVQLVKKLSLLDNVKAIRLLYCYPEHITQELIDEFNVNPKLLPYIDIPFQHADDKILKLMNRKGTGKEYLSLVKNLKKQVKGIAIRSTFITGFPTETDKQFETLVKFIKKAKLFNAGFFRYSREEDTPAYKLSGHLPWRVKDSRCKKLYTVQKRVVKENNLKLVGKTFKVLAEGFDSGGFVYYGRAYFNAPDIDGKVYFFSSEEIEYGKYYDIKINMATGYDLYGERL